MPILWILPAIPQHSATTGDPLIDFAEALTMSLAMGPLAALLFFVPLWGPQVALHGIKGQRTQQSVSYTLADGMILTALMAIASSLASIVKHEIHGQWFLFLMMSANLLAFLLWMKCLKFMSRNGIVGNKQRVLMQLFVYPSSVLSIAYFAISIMMLLSGVIAALNRDFQPSYLAAVLLTLTASAFWIRLTRTVFRKVLSAEQTVEKMSD